MNNQILIHILMIAFLIHGNDKSQQAFESVIPSGYGTAPGGVVVTIKNKNTNTEKEIYTNVFFLYRAFDIELDIHTTKKLKDYLLSKKSDRIFELGNDTALNVIGFDSYQLKSEDEIDDLFLNKG